MDQWPFITGRLYNRQTDIHGRYGGQQRGGIATPSDAPGVFVFTGTSGAKHGYVDGWQPDGSFHYCGEGQIGDMTLTRGNRAVASHSGQSRDLLLFETTGKGKPVRFVGQFVCAGWFVERLPDTQGAIRDAIIFKLVPLELSSDTVASAVPVAPNTADDFNGLRMLAYAAAKRPENVSATSAVTTYFARSQAVRDYALARASGRCECCGGQAPFQTMSGAPYLEVHHIHRLSDGGPDHPSAVAAICPNCHREAHFGVNAEQIRVRLRDVVGKVEGFTYADLEFAGTA